MADKQELVHQELTQLTSRGSPLHQAPPHLLAYFNDRMVVDVANRYLALQTEVKVEGRAVVYSAGPPGAGKSSALQSLNLEGYRKIDPDEAKDLILDEAHRHGLLRYRESFMLADGNAVSIRELVAHVHGISNRVTDLVRKLSLSAGENLIIDGTLSWVPLGSLYVDELYTAGYEGLTVVDVELPLRETLRRAKKRWWDGRQSDPIWGGRFMPESAIRTCYQVGNDEESVCALNAANLAIQAADELGHGTLMRFEVDQSTGSPIKRSETHYGH